HNNAYVRPDATDELVIAATQAARADHFIKQLPHGYDTEISLYASAICAGERQLLTIDRACLANPRLLILDEASLSVDTRTEALIQDALATLQRGRTSFVIAHRLSTIRAADVIVVMDHGDVVEQGTHAQLLAAGGMYHDLYTAQTQHNLEGGRRVATRQDGQASTPTAVGRNHNGEARPRTPPRKPHRIPVSFTGAISLLSSSTLAGSSWEQCCWCSPSRASPNLVHRPTATTQCPLTRC